MSARSQYAERRTSPRVFETFVRPSCHKSAESVFNSRSKVARSVVRTYWHAFAVDSECSHAPAKTLVLARIVHAAGTVLRDSLVTARSCDTSQTTDTSQTKLWLLAGCM